MKRSHNTYFHYTVTNGVFVYEQSLHRSESMVSLACFRTLAQLVISDSPGELQQYLASNKNVNIDDKDEVRR